ncbi:hypothetical protein JBE04_20420 [Streptomyces sp. PRKS01-29]|nr:hypothetical protein [Streptomyces sabulosicollis]MBI0296759.1 hypothetical protein [Streptomyces sabulosicollis]
MSTPIDIAERRAAASSDPNLFLAAFHLGAQATASEDTDGYVRALIGQGDHAAAAGYLEGLASRRQLPPGVHTSLCGCVPCRVRRDERAYAKWQKACRKQVAA